jgi:hypothetical protein
LAEVVVGGVGAEVDELAGVGAVEAEAEAAKGVAMEEDGAGAMGAGVLNSGNLDARISCFFFLVV